MSNFTGAFQHTRIRIVGKNIVQHFYLDLKMIRQLKSIKQIEALLVADLGKDKTLAKITPKIVVMTSASPNECNWFVAEWIGLSRQTEKVKPYLGSRVAEMRQRYKAILPRLQ